LTVDPATNFWSTTLAISDLTAKGLTGTIYYDYRAWGPNWTYDPSWTPGSSVGFVADVDDAGNRFDPNKALLDPYALEVSHDPKTPAAPDDATYCSGSNFRIADTAGQASRGIAVKPEDTGPPVDASGKPTRPFKDEIIYEVDLRGLTENDPGVPQAQQGTFAGAALKAPALKALGVTAVEFQPLQEFQNDTNESNPSTVGVDYWGYRGEDTIRTLKHAKRLWRSYVHGCGAAEIHLDRGSATYPSG
jgi:isoamylase